jgi:hypothetical protein
MCHRNATGSGAGIRVNIAFLASDVSKNGAARWLIFLHRLLVVMQILFGVMLILRIAPHRERGISQSGARGIENDAEEQRGRE